MLVGNSNYSHSSSHVASRPAARLLLPGPRDARTTKPVEKLVLEPDAPIPQAGDVAEGARERVLVRDGARGKLGCRAEPDVGSGEPDRNMRARNNIPGQPLPSEDLSSPACVD